MGDNLKFAGSNASRTSPISIKDISHELQEVMSLPHIEDFGRESLGIFDFNNLDFGRESSNFLQDDIGRESLGIINLNHLDIGRESLGITNIKTYDFIVSNVNLPQVQTSPDAHNNGDIPNIKTDFTTEDDVLSEGHLSKLNEISNCGSSVLNMAFLQLPKASAGSSVSSMCPSFNSNSLGSSLPSRIFSTSGSSKNNVLNEAFWSSSQLLKKLQLGAKSPNSPIYSVVTQNNKSHRRIHSLPSSLDLNHVHIDNGLVELEIDKDRALSPRKLSLVIEKKTVSAVEEDEDFNDSVFIEGKHIASRIVDGSFLGTEDDMLDSIQEPEEFANISVGDEEPIKSDVETVFKNVDKMFLPVNNDTVNPDSDKITSKSTGSSTRSSSSKSSKEALEIINTLSEILNNNNPSEKQKSEGQNLLSSLTEILLSSTSTRSRSCILDDSGHSSIESEPHTTPDGGGKCYEVLDLRKKSSSESSINRQRETEDNCVPLDLSMKSRSTYEKTFVSPKTLPPKYNRLPHRSGNVQFNKSLGSTCSLSSNDSNDSIKKFKPKKVDDRVSGLRKGPMKAVLPVDNMARRSNGGLKITPTRAELKPPPNYKKKTSTPINESNMKPMAQSTPDNPNRKSAYATSPLARPTQSPTSSPKTLKQKLNYSSSNLPVNRSSEVKNRPNSQLKRSSSDDLKKPQAAGRQFVRSYSLGEKSKPVLKTRTSVQQISSAGQMKPERKFVLRENKIVGGIRSSIGKKVGKENIN